MTTGANRFTISVTSSMENELDRLKRESYYNQTYNKMLRDLISRGLESLAEEAEAESDEDGVVEDIA